MPLTEFMGWQYLEQREPWGDRRLDHVIALLACTLANIHRGPNATPFKVSDFMTQWDAPENPPQAADPFAQFEAYAEVHNQQLLRKDSIN